MSQAAFMLRGRNPDVLSCIANLSNDEVFTPPEFENQMLDTLADAWSSEHDGKRIWANSAITFLDPCTKSGVFPPGNSHAPDRTGLRMRSPTCKHEWTTF